MVQFVSGYNARQLEIGVDLSPSVAAVARGVDGNGDGYGDGGGGDALQGALREGATELLLLHRRRRAAGECQESKNN